MTDPEYLNYQRVHLGALYGFVRIIDGPPARPYCCSATPMVYVHAVGWLDTDDGLGGWDAPEGGYYSVSEVTAGLTGDVFPAEDDDDAREEAHGNW